MKKVFGALFLTCLTVSTALSQAAPLTLVRSIVLDGVSGKFDHFAFDSSSNRLFIAATGNHSVEVVDAQTGKRLETIRGLGKPHGLAWVAETGRLFVADGTLAALKVYSGAPLALIGTVKLSDDADDMVYDPKSKLLYVGHGGSDAATPGRIAVIDTTNLKLVANLPTASHPEALEIDEAGSRIFANIADAGEVVVIDGRSHAITQHWPLTRAKDNVPLAFDAANNLLLVGCRTPGRLVALNAVSGNELVDLPASAGTDDLFFDTQTSRAFLIGGTGTVDVYEVRGKQVSASQTIHTSPGAKTALLVPSRRELFVGEPGANGKPSGIAVYSVVESR